MKLLTCISLLILLLIKSSVFAALPINANTKVISGVVSWPEDFTPSKPASYQLSLIELKEINGLTYPSVASSTRIMILEQSAASSTAFNFLVESAENLSWKLIYNLYHLSSCCNSGLSEYGIWSQNGTKSDFLEGEILTVDKNHQYLDFPLSKALNISGNAYRASNSAMWKDQEFLIVATHQNGTRKSKLITISAGQSFEKYHLKLADQHDLSSATGDWVLSYEACHACGVQVYQSGFYSDSGTVLYEEDASLIKVEGESRSVDLSLIEGELSEVSGIITWPETFTPSSTAYINLKLEALDSQKRYLSATSTSIYLFANSATSTNFTAPTSTPFTFKTLLHTKNDWRLTYDCLHGCEGVGRTGAWNSNGTTNIENAEILDGELEHQGLSFELLGSKTMSGAIKLPDGEILSDATLGIHLFDGFTEHFIALEGNTNSVEYSLSYPSTDTLKRVGLWVGSLGVSDFGKNYYSRGYYSLSGTVIETSLATLLEAKTDHQNIDITIQRLKPLDVTIFLPEGELASTDFDVSINLSRESDENSIFQNERFEHLRSVSAIIPAGQNSITISVGFPELASDDWFLGYVCTLCPEYYPFGYYSGLNSTAQYSNVSLLNPNDYLNTDIKLPLIKLGNANNPDKSHHLLETRHIGKRPTSDTLEMDGDGDGLSEFIEIVLGTNPEKFDSDSDTWGDGHDNCPLTANSYQLDFDKDKAGNACDFDDDNDGVLDENDVFPLNANESVDTDKDGIGNNADTDDDNDLVLDVDDAFPLDANESMDADKDGVGDNADNCPKDFNANQLDTDLDQQGDLCDIDDDNDGMPDAWELKFGFDPWVDDSALDPDKDTLSNLEEFQLKTNPNLKDTDNDTIRDDKDNCPILANKIQKDSDGDEVGDVCEDDVCFPIQTRKGTISVICL